MLITRLVLGVDLGVLDENNRPWICLLAILVFSCVVSSLDCDIFSLDLQGVFPCGIKGLLFSITAFKM